MITGGVQSAGPARGRPYLDASWEQPTASPPQTMAPPPRTELPPGAAPSQTPIFEQTAAFLGTPEIYRAPLHGVVVPREPLETPPTAESPDPAALPGASDVYGVTRPVEAVWSPAADGAPGIFADPAGRRRIRVRWLAVSAGLLLSAFLVVGAVGLLGGPKAPVLPWTM